MLDRIRTRANDESGFTLVELLVVMLILGILAAIAIPSFFSQRDKANDADAKSAARTAQTAMETYATDNDGSYAGASVVDLAAIEPTLNDSTITLESAAGAVVAPTATSYSVTAVSSTGNRFEITRLAGPLNEGETDLLCTTGGEGGCPTGGSWE